MVDLLIYACEVCQAQFSVMIPRAERPSVPPSQAYRPFSGPKKKR